MSDPSFPSKAAKRLCKDIFTFVANRLLNLLVLFADLVLSVINLATVDKNKPVGNVGRWGGYVPPKQGDSRCSCPALNALANHGILPHDGQNIQFLNLSETVYQTYGLSPTASMLLTVFGGNLEDIRPFLTEERLPDNWEPCIRHQMGLTIMELSSVALGVELGIMEEIDGTLDQANPDRDTY
ncbi:Chloroperoxidase [Cerioporus squamosus]|nr:Chloroperoxidase [Cerioporus squamosus]